MTNHAVCIYTHANCTDGLFSAYIAYAYAKTIVQDPDIIIVPISHNKPYTRQESKLDIFVDLVPPAQDLSSIKDLIVIDHHKSNSEFCQTLKERPRCQVHFDLEACASQICLQTLNSQLPEKIHDLVKYVDDRDRWTWQHPESKEINQALSVHLQPLKRRMSQIEIRKAFSRIESLPSIEELASQGKTFLMYSTAIVNDLVALATYQECQINNTLYRVGCCETNIFRSEVGDALMSSQDKKIDFAISWSYDMNKDEYWLSLRSTDQGADVGKIAKLLNPNGGGHRNASGCSVKSLAFLKQNHKK